MRFRSSLVLLTGLLLSSCESARQAPRAASPAPAAEWGRVTAPGPVFDQTRDAVRAALRTLAF